MQKGFQSLSNREQEVALKVTTGASNKVIAADLFVTEKTIKFHLTNIYKKMGVKSRAQLIVDSITKNWAPRPEIQEEPILPGEKIAQPEPPVMKPSEDVTNLPGRAL